MSNDLWSDTASNDTGNGTGNDTAWHGAWNGSGNDTAVSRNLWERLTHGASRSRRSLHVWTGDRYEASSWPVVVRDAEAMTAGLRRAGVQPGTRVATVLTNTPESVRGLLGVWLAGGVVASLPAPARGLSAEEYTTQLTLIHDQLEPAVFVLDAAMLALLPDDLRGRLGARSWQSFAGTGRIDAAPPGDDEPAFIQFSSGSTGTPKGCVLSTAAIAAQLDIVATMLDVRPERDVGVSWLPLSHDMGLFGCLLTPWWTGMTAYLSTPERFMFAPGTWFSDMAEHGGTVTAGSNTALYLAARSLDRPNRSARSGRLPWRGLSPVRSVIIGAEPVGWNMLRYAVDVLGPYGFTAEALMPAYGLAEATLAVTATPLTERPQRVAVDPVALADGQLVELAADDPAATAVVSAGTPCQGVDLHGVPASPAGERSEIREIGEIVVRSPALAMGYHGDEARTRAHFTPDGLRTGDLGFVHNGQLYPTGRADDVISVAGRKVYAREVEAAVDQLAGVRRGSTLVAHGDAPSMRLTLFIELQRRQDDYRPLAEQAAALAMTKAALALDECVFLGRGSLPKTPSGKIQRHRCRQLHQAGRFEPLATVEFATARIGRTRTGRARSGGAR